jgi:excisionase family DNA binding protein
MNENITVREASQLTGYSTEYIRELCRAQKIKSGKFGTLLVVNPVSLLEYKQEQDARRASRKVAL